MKIKLRKILAENEIGILKEIFEQTNISFEIFEAGKIFLKFNATGIELEKLVRFDFDELDEVCIKMERENNLIIDVIKHMIENEIEKKLLAGEILDKYKELSIFCNISEKMSYMTQISDIAKEAFDEAGKYIKSSYGVLAIRGENGNKIKRIFEYNSYSNEQKINLGSKLVKKVMNERLGDIVNDVSVGEYGSVGNHIVSVICAPISVKNNIRGIFAMGSHEKRNYSSGDLKLVSAIAFLMGISIENFELYKGLEDTFFQTVKALSETIEKRDTYTGGHVQRVTEYSELIGQKMGLERDERTKLKLAALMHDIGKIGIEDSILRKAMHLSEDEYEEMQKHTVLGAEIIAHITHLQEIVPGVRGHHERFDGSGYPDGIVGEKISLIGRIIAVADAFDAMITDRPYRKALKFEDAVYQLEKYSGCQFDPDVVKAFLEILNETKAE